MDSYGFHIFAFGFFVVPPLVIFLLPFDWWQVAPSRLLGKRLDVRPRYIFFRTYFLDRLVIRPSTGERKCGFLERFFVPGEFLKGIVLGREYRHIFVLVDAGEADIVNALNRGKLGVLGWNGIGIGLSLLLAVGKL